MDGETAQMIASGGNRLFAIHGKRMKVFRPYLFSQKDVGHMEQLIYKPIYMLPFVLEELSGQ